MEIKQKLNIPKPNFELDSSVMFLGNEEEIERYRNEVDRIVNEWQNLLLEIIDGKTKCISIDKNNTVCTLSRGIENKDTVRYSNFFKKKNGRLDAILHHEFSKEDLDVLIHTYLFAISEDKSIQVGDILLDSNKKERKLMKTFDELLEVAEKRYGGHGNIKDLLVAYSDLYDREFGMDTDISEVVVNKRISHMNESNLLTFYSTSGKDYFGNNVSMACMYDVVAREYLYNVNGNFLDSKHAEYKEVIGDLEQGFSMFNDKLLDSLKEYNDIVKVSYGIDDKEIQNESDLKKTSKAKKMLDDLKDRPSDFSQEKVQEKNLDK